MKSHNKMSSNFIKSEHSRATRLTNRLSEWYQSEDQQHIQEILAEYSISELTQEFFDRIYNVNGNNPENLTIAEKIVEYGDIDPERFNNILLIQQIYHPGNQATLIRIMMVYGLHNLRDIPQLIDRAMRGNLQELERILRNFQQNLE